MKLVENLFRITVRCQLHIEAIEKGVFPCHGSPRSAPKILLTRTDKKNQDK